ncbi:retrotransposon protein, putative, ty1-copia subclass [Tanacetum coccineum]
MLAKTRKRISYSRFILMALRRDFSGSLKSQGFITNGKGNDKQIYIPKPKNPKPSSKENPAKDDTCHQCKEVGHCKRNSPAYHVELIKKKKQVGTASSSDVFIIELFSFPTKSWVYDTSCGTHICNTKHGLGGVKKLKQVEAIRSFNLVLPNGLVICLDNCHNEPSITRGVVSVHWLVENGFVQHFTDFGISVSKNNVHYYNAIPSNGIYEIDMHNLVPNLFNSIYNVITKRAKHNLDSTYLWHCRLAHISKKRIEKLQQEGLLKSTDDESFDQCVSCLSGKMTRKSFPHRPERATDLLGIIHTDVCGPLRHVSRQGASYFITFMDDYSHYGYVYLLKHKHEVFETFKVFKNEVENQLGKTIKALRSDRGGEYISQEFKDYLKACGIVQQLTPPYTPQHNGVSERRNYTLLDMVRSMMNLTTLPLSFCDYALESATRILNMVPTKKVDKTPYELWYGKVPNLSYLKVWGCEALVKRDMPDKL